VTDHPHPPPGPMSPGTYIAKRREHAGLDQVDVAVMISADEDSARQAGVRLMRLEGGALERIEGIEVDIFLDRLLAAFRFRKDIFRALVAAQADPTRPVPPVCRECACSFFDPCFDDHGLTCCWTNAGSGEEPLCSQCDVEPAPAGPIGGAGREEVHHAA
jgi:hypothetical protein